MLYIIERDQLSEECIADCSHWVLTERGALRSGSCDDDVSQVKGIPLTFWIERVTLDIPADQIRQCLKGYGAWDETELADDYENRKRLLWVVCGNFNNDPTETMFCVE